MKKIILALFLVLCTVNQAWAQVTYNPPSGKNWSVGDLKNHILERLAKGENITSTPYENYPAAYRGDIQQAWDSARNETETKKLLTDIQNEKSIRDKYKYVGCLPPAEYGNGSNPALSCWTCELFKRLFISGNNLSKKIFDTLVKPMKMLAGLLLAFWILFQVANAFLNFRGIKGSQMLLEMGKMGIRFVFVFSLLGAGTQIFRLVIDPLVSITMDFGKAAYPNQKGLVCPKAAMITEDGAILKKDTYETMCMLINGTYQEVRKVMDISSELFWNGWQAGAPIGWGIGNYLGIKFPDMMMISIGFFVWITFAFLFIQFPFSILDSLFKFILLAGFLPVFAVTWLFKRTKDYTLKAFAEILGCCVHLMVISIVFVVIISLLGSMFSGALGATSMDQLLKLCSEKKFAQLANYLAGDQDGAKGNGNGFLTLLTIVATGLFSILALRKADEVASELVQANANSQVGMEAFGSAANTVSKVGSPTGAATDYLKGKVF